MLFYGAPPPAEPMVSVTNKVTIRWDTLADRHFLSQTKFLYENVVFGGSPLYVGS